MYRLFACVMLLIPGIIVFYQCSVNIAYSQDIHSLGLKKSPLQKTPELPDYLPETDAEDDHFTLPPVPAPHPTSPAAGVSFLLTDIIFEKNSIFSQQELKQSVNSFINNHVTLADLEEIRYRLTRFYVDQGYVNSGALIKPGQKVVNGVVTYLIIEGTLNQINVSGNGRLRPNYIKKRIWPDPGIPFNTFQLQEYFQMLLQDPLIQRMDGRILPGTKLGEALLELNVKRAKPHELSIGVDNHSSPNLGAETMFVDSTLRDITGFGDSLDIYLSFTKGTEEINATYSIPLTPDNTMLSLHYTCSESDVVTDSLKDLGIKSKLNSKEVSLFHPLYHTLRRNFKVGLSLKTEESRSFIMGGTPFAFSDGAVDGISKATVLRLIQSFQDRTSEQVVALRSSFSFGIDLFNPTVHSQSLPDGLFVSWLGQIQYARRLGEKTGQIVFRGDVQLTDDYLLSMEQFSVGGAESVRGYRENQYVGDNGYLLSLEWRIPLWEGRKEKPSMFQVVPFMDYGTAWDRHESVGDHAIHSAGVGFTWTSPRISAELYYGYAIENAHKGDDYNIQDDGIHFKVTYNFP